MSILDAALDLGRMGSVATALREKLAVLSRGEPFLNGDEDEYTEWFDQLVERIEEQAPQTLGELMEGYDFGEPLSNGLLVCLARELIDRAPESVRVSSIEELESIDHEGLSYFHHGDVTIEGQWANISESVAITGDLDAPHAALEAGFLDAFPDLLVAGNVRVRCADWMGLSCVGGDLIASQFMCFEYQGEQWVLGSIECPLIIGGSLPSGHAKGAPTILDIEDHAAIASHLGVEDDTDDVTSVIDQAMKRGESS